MRQLLYLTAAFLVGSILTAFLMGRAPTEPTVETVTIYDTIPYYYPVARDSVVVRYETHRLPVSGDKSPEQEQKTDVEKADSVDVVIPITQKEYQDSTYHLWISGYAANLDSIHTFTRHDYTTVTLPPAKPKRWHIGPTVGIGYTSHGFEPFIGVSLTYSIIDL